LQHIWKRYDWCRPGFQEFGRLVNYKFMGMKSAKVNSLKKNTPKPRTCALPDVRPRMRKRKELNPNAKGSQLTSIHNDRKMMCRGIIWKNKRQFSRRVLKLNGML
jgi:hypothetical protein